MGFTYIPISGDVNNFSTEDYAQLEKEINIARSKTLMTEVRTKSVIMPTELSELCDGEDTFTNDISIDAALSLKLPVGAVDGKLSRRIFVQEYSKYKKVNQGEQSLLVGISIRWIVNIKKLNASADISSLPMVTASAQFNHVNASARFEVKGISSKKLTGLIPAPVELNADTYAELNNAFKSIKALIWDDDTTIAPSVIAILGEVREEENKPYQEALGAAWALTKIKQKRKLSEALQDVMDESNAFVETVKSVYLDVAGISELSIKPSNIAAEKARQLSKDFELDD